MDGLGHLFIRAAGGHQAQHFELALGELRRHEGRLRSGAEVEPAQHSAGHRLNEGPEILSRAANWSPALQKALEIWKDITLLLVARLRAAHGLDTGRLALHMSFTGRPGTGKTSVAMRMAKILHHLGYVRKGHLVVATGDDLVGQYVGHTAPRAVSP
jgi:hypothetical protein